MENQMTDVRVAIPAIREIRGCIEAGEITALELFDELLREKARAEIFRRLLIRAKDMLEYPCTFEVGAGGYDVKALIAEINRDVTQGT